ncbi:MAG: hypothetical protein ACFBSE_10430 [Prochloraceae cyanobacterium]
MSEQKQLSLRSQTKLLKKSIEKKLIAHKIYISNSKTNSKSFLFWLQTIIAQNNTSSWTIEAMAGSIASELIQICQEKDKSTVDTKVIDRISKTYIPPVSSQTPQASASDLPKSSEDTSHRRSTELVPSVPPELVELFEQNKTDSTIEAWSKFAKQLNNAPFDRIPTAGITDAVSSEDLIVFSIKQTQLAIGNSSAIAIDIPVAKMPGVEVGTYKELRSDLTFKVGTGDDGNQYITQWGNENRGGLQIDAKTIVLFLKE